MIAKIKSLFQPKQKQLNLFEALDQSMRYGHWTVDWNGVIW